MIKQYGYLIAFTHIHLFDWLVVTNNFDQDEEEDEISQFVL